jgi:hypothetical protein
MNPAGSRTVTKTMIATTKTVATFVFWVPTRCKKRTTKAPADGKKLNYS